MLNTTPEYLSAHQRDLAAMASTAGAAEAIAQRRGRRRQKLSQFVAAINQAAPFRKETGETKVAREKRRLAI